MPNVRPAAVPGGSEEFGTAADRYRTHLQLEVMRIWLAGKERELGREFADGEREAHAETWHDSYAESFRYAYGWVALLVLECAQDGERHVEIGARFASEIVHEVRERSEAMGEAWRAADHTRREQCVAGWVSEMMRQSFLVNQEREEMNVAEIAPHECGARGSPTEFEPAYA